MLFNLAIKSLVARKVSIGLSIFSICISIFVLLAVNHIRTQAKESFTQTVSGVDLIVGARTGQLNLLLYSVFRMGNATNNISWQSYKALKDRQEVAWTIPLSMGDSHRGFRVIGTTQDYFSQLKYSQAKSLNFASGRAFAHTLEAVIGSSVARQLNYHLGDKIILSHGIANNGFNKHDNQPFTIVGILDPTGTPVDQSVHVNLESIELIHKGWQSGVNLSAYIAKSKVQGQVPKQNSSLEPKAVTAVLVGLNSKMATFSFQRAINNYSNEPLMAILPGVALAELWQMMAMVENLLILISALVLLAALVGMATTMMASMRERQQEFKVLRTIGARPVYILCLIQMEALVLVLLSLILAILALTGALQLAHGFLLSNWGLNISPSLLVSPNLKPILAVVICAQICAVLPALTAYAKSKNI